MNYFEESKVKWGQERWGFFTGSNIFKLLVKGSGTTFGKGAMTYIEQVACQCYTNYEANDFEGTYAMREGRKKEPEASKFYEKIISHLFINGENLKPHYFGEKEPNFKKYNEYSGVSSDEVLFIGNTPYIVAEFKCPTRDVHFFRLREIKKYTDNQSHLFIKEHYPEYYAQIQFNMMAWCVKLGHWCSYNEYFPMDKRMLIIEVPEDKPFQNNLKIVLEMANKKKLEILETVK